MEALLVELYRPQKPKKRNTEMLKITVSGLPELPAKRNRTELAQAISHALGDVIAKHEEWTPGTIFYSLPREQERFGLGDHILVEITALNEEIPASVAKDLEKELGMAVRRKFPEAHIGAIASPLAAGMKNIGWEETSVPLPVRQLAHA